MLQSMRTKYLRLILTVMCLHCDLCLPCTTSYSLPIPNRSSKRGSHHPHSQVLCRLGFLSPTQRFKGSARCAVGAKNMRETQADGWASMKQTTTLRSPWVNVVQHKSSAASYIKPCRVGCWVRCVGGGGTATHLAHLEVPRVG